MDLLNAIIKSILENSRAVIVVLIFFYILLTILAVFYFMRKKKEEKLLTSDIDVLLDGEKKEEKKKVSMIGIEEFVYTSLHIDDKPIMIMLVRLGVIIGIIALGFAFKLLAVFFAFEVVMILVSKVQDKQLEDEIGISRTEKINKFLDFYIPSVASGTSVRQTMQNFIALEGDKALVDWYYNQESSIPQDWAEVINVYNNGINSEEAGLPDKAELYQLEVDRLMFYFNEYKSKNGEIAPICYCYYIGVPIISIMSYNNLPDVWMSVTGLVLVFILCILFFAFNRLVQKQKSDCCEKIF